MLFGLVVFAGIVGYSLIEGWSLEDAAWMVFITITTIGYGEVHTLSGPGRLFTVVLIVGGLSLGSYALSQATAYILEGGLLAQLEERRIKRVMAEFSDHFIVAGFGRTGEEIAMDLRHAGLHVVVVDNDKECVEKARAAGFAAIYGNASNDDVLVSAGVDRVKGVAVAADSDAINVFITLSVRQLNPDAVILCRVDHEPDIIKAERAGADGVVSPHKIGGTAMAHALMRPHSATFLRQAFARTHPDLAMEDIEIGRDPTYHNTLKRLQIRARFRVIVVAIQKRTGELVTAPGPEAVLAKGDIAVAMGNPDDIHALRVAVEGQ